MSDLESFDRAFREVFHTPEWRAKVKEMQESLPARLGKALAERGAPSDLDMDKMGEWLKRHADDEIEI